MSWQRWGDREGGATRPASRLGCAAAMGFAVAVDAGLLWLIWWTFFR